MPTPFTARWFYRPRVARPVSGGRPNGRFQKRTWRRLRGLLRAVRCPVCRMPTRQMMAPPAPDVAPETVLAKVKAAAETVLAKGGITVKQARRTCLSCKTTFTKGDARGAR
jgi:hypothetical protein